jgi:hypothetical protein
MEIQVGFALDGFPCPAAGRSAKGKQMIVKPATLFAHCCITATKAKPLPVNS